MEWKNTPSKKIKQIRSGRVSYTYICFLLFVVLAVHIDEAGRTSAKNIKSAIGSQLKCITSHILLVYNRLSSSLV